MTPAMHNEIRDLQDWVQARVLRLAWIFTFILGVAVTLVFVQSVRMMFATETFYAVTRSGQIYVLQPLDKARSAAALARGAQRGTGGAR